MKNKIIPRGIYLISGGFLLVGLIYILYGLIGRVAFVGEVSRIKQTYLIIIGAISVILSYGIYIRKEIARKFAVLLFIALSVVGPIKSLGYMICVGNYDLVKVLIHVGELGFFLFPAIYLIRAVTRISFDR